MAQQGPVYNGFTPTIKPGSVQLSNQNYFNYPAPEPSFEFMKANAKEKLDWAKFAMWLRGFLAAIEGQELKPENVEKIMEKLAYVDPDKKLSLNQFDFQQLPNWSVPQSAPQVVPNPYIHNGGSSWTATDLANLANVVLNSNVNDANIKSPNIAKSKLTSSAGSTAAK